MQYPTYFRWSLLLSYLIGVLATQIDSFLASLIVLAFLHAAVPYAAFAACVYYWSIGRSNRTLMVATLVLPVLFLPVAVATVLLFYGHGSEISLHVVVDFTLLIGYACAAISWALWGLLLVARRRGSRPG